MTSLHHNFLVSSRRDFASCFPKIASQNDGPHIPPLLMPDTGVSGLVASTVSSVGGNMAVYRKQQPVVVVSGNGDADVILDAASGVVASSGESELRSCTTRYSVTANDPEPNSEALPSALHKGLEGSASMPPPPRSLTMMRSKKRTTRSRVEGDQHSETSHLPVGQMDRRWSATRPG